MAQQVQVLYIDDIDGSEAEGTVRFALDGSDYEIDLSAKHEAELRRDLAQYIEHARRAPGQHARGGRPGSRGPRGGANSDGVNTQEVRAWAGASGIEIKDRGRIPADVVARFKASRGVPIAAVNGAHAGTKSRPAPAATFSGTEPWPGFGTATTSTIRGKFRKWGTPAELREAIAYERQTNDRGDIIDMLNNRLARVEAGN